MTESMPSRLTPRNKKGMTVVSNFGPAARPQATTEPPYFTWSKRGRGCGPRPYRRHLPMSRFRVAVCSAPIDRLAEQSRRRKRLQIVMQCFPSRRRTDAVSKTRQNCDRDRPDAARRTGNEYRAGGRRNTVIFKRFDAQHGCQTGGTNRHRLTGRVRPARQRANRHSRALFAHSRPSELHRHANRSERLYPRR